MFTSSWKKPRSGPLGLKTKKNIPAAVTPPSLLPTVETPVSLRLGENCSLIYENGNWYSMDSGTGTSNGAEIMKLQSEIQQLRENLKQVTQQKNLLEFKNQLLLDMLTVTTLDLNAATEEAQKGKQQQQTDKPKMAGGGVKPRAI
eukprot:TRINITY_DN3002_c0_g1_i1.p1 TRINITY_DN3002_c0_g1~~TRINITY_DN3002_c0_g1_i1.p1  ORF type:complete len:145 (-),score=42.25 TRINITY_DN3002_c0_g1_i1:102-536(-)